MRKRAFGTRFAAAIAIVALLCAAVLAMAGCSCTQQPANEEIEVPDVTQMTSEKAKKTIEDAGLKVGKVTTESNDTVPEDVVISQLPEAKTKVGKGSEVSLVVSSGAATDMVEVPDLTGMTFDDANQQLVDLNLDVYQINDYSDDVPEGVVISQSIDPGTQVAVGTTVTLDVSLGAQPTEQVTVPDVSGMAGSDASDAMKGAGLTLDYDVRNPDRVLSGTDPQAGTLVDPGTIIEAQYAPDPEPQPEGGWEFNGQATASVSSDAQAVFDAGNPDGRTAIAVLATRNGSDYAFLCVSDSNWSIISMSSDGQGGASVLSDTSIDPSNVITADNSYGDWTVADAPGVDLQPADAQAAFDAASEGYTGVRLSPVATLATQVVAGTNYLAICIGTPATANPANQIFVATIYAAVDGSCSFSDVSQLDLTSYAG